MQVARPSPFASLPKFRRGAFAIFLLTAVLSALLGDQPMAEHLVLLPGAVLDGVDVWTPITTNFIYPPGTLLLLVGTAFMQWFIGSEMEGFWGMRKYLTLVVGAGIAGHLTSVLLGLMIDEVAATPVGGATAMDMATVTAFGFVYANRPLRLLAAIPLKSQHLAMLIVGLTILGPVLRGAPWPVMVPWIVAVAVAALVTTQPWRRLRDSGKLGGSKKPKKRHLRVVRPDSELLN